MIELGRHLRRTSDRNYPAWALAMLGCLVLSYSVFLFDGDTIYMLTEEDGVVEMLGAMMFLAASVLFLITYYRSGECASESPRGIARRRNFAYLLLGLLFMFCFLEEISWGQRLLGFGSPEAFAEGNRQGETNIHNLELFHGLDADGERKSFWQLLLNMDRLFTLFWLTLCVIVPAAALLPRLRKWLTQIRFPIFPLTLAGLFLLNYAISRFLAVQHPLYQHSAVEVKESVCALLFFFAAMSQFEPVRLNCGKVANSDAID